MACIPHQICNNIEDETGVCGMHEGEKKKRHMVLVEKVDGKRPLVGRAHKCDIIELDLKEIRWDGLD